MHTITVIDGLLQYAELFFFNDTATTEIYTLSLHDALPISDARRLVAKAVYFGTLSCPDVCELCQAPCAPHAHHEDYSRSEEHTSELQSQSNLVCRLLLEQKKAHAARAACHALPPRRRCSRD